MPDYIGLPDEVEPTEATEAEVDNVIEGLRAERADFKAADRPAQKGDYVKLAYEGTMDGKPIAELAPDKQLYGKVPADLGGGRGRAGGTPARARARSWPA